MRRDPFRVGKSLTDNRLSRIRVTPSKLAHSENVIVHGLKVTASPVKSQLGRSVFLDLSLAQALELRDALTACMERMS